MRLRQLAALAIAAGLVTAACGGDDGTEPAASADTETTDDTGSDTDDTDTDDTDTETTDDAGSDTDDTGDETESDDTATDDTAADDTTDDGGATVSDDGVVPGDDATGKPEVQLPADEPTELVITDLIEGSGEAAEAGDTVVTHFVGVLTADGTEFAESYSTERPPPFVVGQTFPGLDDGMVGVKAGGRRQLDIPPELAFGETGDGQSIPPDASLTLVLDIQEVIKPPPPPTLPPQADAADCPAADGSSEPVQEFDEYPPTCIDVTTTYTAEVETNHGAFEIDLDPERAPVTVNNFVVLARYHYFDGTECHRAIPGFVVQCGDPTATGSGGPGYTFGDELPEAGEYQIGSLAMANSGANTNGSQFFIITGENGAALPPQYSLFGQVGDGLDDTVPALDALGNDDPASNGVPPLETITIESVTITES